MVEFKRWSSTLTNRNGQNLEEIVYVLVETDILYEHIQHSLDIDEFIKQAWRALWKQYPVWKSPYDSSNCPPNAKESFKHCSFSSAIMHEIIPLPSPYLP